MMRSVSISLPRIGTAVPLTVMILTMPPILPRSLVVAHVENFPVQRRRRYHRGTHQQGPPLRASLPSNEITIGRRRANLASVELVRVHRQAHRAASFPPLETGLFEDLVQTFLLRELFDGRRA